MLRRISRALAMTAALALSAQPALPIAPFVGAAFLVACANKTADQLQQDVQLIVAGAQSVVQTMRGLPAGTVPADILDKAQDALDDINANSAAIGTALAPNANAVSAIANAVSTLSALLTPYFPVAPSIAAVVQAIVALVPVILLSVGKASAPSASPRPAMSADQARTVLRSVR